MTARERRFVLLGSVLLFLSAGWGQSRRSDRHPRMERGSMKLSGLPAFSPGAVVAEEAEEEAPSHRSVPEFPMPATHLPKQPVVAVPAAGGAKSAAAAPVTAVAKPASAMAAASSFNSLNSPSPALSFQSMPMISSFPPDTTGAVSPNYVMSASNEQVIVQDRQGYQLTSTSLNNFWNGAFPDIYPAWDPNLRYDPYADRWIFVCMGNYEESGSSMLIGVSATSDPTGSWNLRRILSDSTTTTFDHPRVGFNNNWIVVTGNQIQNSTSTWIYSVIYAFDKADLYANGSKAPAEWNNITNDFTITPALTYDPTVSTMYLMANYNGNDTGSSPAMGYLSLSTITGAVDSEMLSLNTAYPGTTNTWASTVPQNFAPQLGSTATIGVFDARMNTVVYRNGSLWATHTAFVPASSPTIAAVDWWQVTTDGTVQQFGRLQDPNSVFFYTYPSLAVNQNGDMLVGYSRMASTQYASAAYAFRAADDPANTLRNEYVMEAGQGAYANYDNNNVNRWGDYSATQVDPINDTDFWTVQEYAGPQTSQSQWGTWWASIIAPGSSAASLQSVTVKPTTVTGGGSSTGTVMLSMEAPSGGLAIAVASNNPVAQVPADGTVIVQAKTNSATFPITTSAVTNSTPVTISATYNGVTEATTLTLTPGATQSITFSVLPNMTYGVSPIALTSTASSGLPVSYSVTGPATVTGSTLTVTGAGRVTVTANQAGNGYYLAATPVSQSFSVLPAPLAVVVNNQAVALGMPIPPLTGTLTGVVAGDGIYASYSTSAIAGSPGTYPITASLQGPDSKLSNYTVSITNGVLVIFNTSLPLSLWLSSNSAAVGGAGFPLTVDGVNFTSGSWVLWNGAVRATAFVSSTQLTATILASDIAAPMTNLVTVTIPAPNAATSAALPFVAMTSNPVASISGASLSAADGSGNHLLALQGTGFVSGSTVEWTGTGLVAMSLVTTYVSPWQISAVVTESEYGSPQAVVTVANPAGTSAGFELNTGSQ